MSDQLTSDESGLAFGIGERGKVGTSQASIERMQLRKYETIKKMTIYLHSEEEREWGRYCPYGCHCAIDGQFIITLILSYLNMFRTIQFTRWWRKTSG
jgi:hypothetical protein